MVCKEVRYQHNQFNVRPYPEQRYIIETNDGNIVLNKYEKTSIENIYIGIKYIREHECTFEKDPRENAPENSMSKQIFLIDLLNKVAIVTNYQIKNQT